MPSNNPQILSSFCSIPTITVSWSTFTSIGSSFNNLSIFSFIVLEFFNINFIISLELVFTQYGTSSLCFKYFNTLQGLYIFDVFPMIYPSYHFLIFSLSSLILKSFIIFSTSSSVKPKSLLNSLFNTVYTSKLLAPTKNAFFSYSGYSCNYRFF